MKTRSVVLLCVLVLAVVIALLFVRNMRMIRDAQESTSTQITTGTTTASIAAGTYSKTIQSGGITRSYQIHIPTSYDSSQVVPLVFVIHGGGGNGKQILVGTKFDLKADAEKFIVVAPDGVDNNWNDGRGSTARGETTASVTQNDDVAFIKELLLSIEQSYDIDTKRIYITGVSNGAMMSQRMICDAPGTFAAVGAMSGPMRTQTVETCKGTASVVGIQGTDDPFFPIEDGNGIPTFPLILRRNAEQTVITEAQIASIWVGKNSCNTNPTVSSLPTVVQDGTSVTKYTYMGCSNSTAVEYYIVKGMGHGWPPNTNAKTENLAGPTSGNINATDVVWSFFKLHPKS